MVTRLRSIGVALAFAVALLLLIATAASAREKIVLMREIGEGRGSGPGQLYLPRAVAVDDVTGDVYVSELVNQRVDEFTATGSFVMMFGRDVNLTKDSEPKATQVEKDICVSGEECGSGEEGEGSGEFNAPQGIAVEQSTGDIYVVDKNNHRVEKFTAAGQFVLMFGDEVNITKDGEKGATQAEKNLCTAASGAECGAGTVGSGPGAFMTWEGNDSVLAIEGGASPTIYVGDESRVQEFNSSGTAVGEVSLSGALGGGDVTALAVDSTGNLYLKYSSATGVRKFNDAGIEEGNELFDQGSNSAASIAVSPTGEVIVIDGEPAWHGSVYSASGDVLTSSFGEGTIVYGSGVTLHEGPGGPEIYVADGERPAVEVFNTVLLPTATSSSPTEITGTAAHLNGEVNPEGLEATSLFEYGTTPAFGNLTATTSDGAGNAGVLVHTTISGLLPNQQYFYRVSAHNENGTSPSETTEHFETSAIAPVIGETSPISVSAEGALFRGALDPEHSETLYHIEYGSCVPVEECGSVAPNLESAAYGDVNFEQSISGLRSATVYHYRLVAASKPHIGGRKTAFGPEGEFETLPSPRPTVGVGMVGQVSDNSAVVSSVVESPVVPGSYAVEIEAPGSTWVTVARGMVSANAGPQVVVGSLSGLAPATTYECRVTINNGYQSVTGASVAFSTLPVAKVFETPGSAMLIPTPSFPQIKQIKIVHKNKSKAKKKRKKKIGKKHKKKK